MSLVDIMLERLREVPYTIGLTSTFLIIGLIITYYIGETWIQPENERLFKQYCPNGIDKCGLIIDQNPAYIFIPLCMLVLGMSLGCKLDGLSNGKNVEDVETK